MTKERTISSDRIYSGKMVSLKVDTVEVSEGRTAIREIVNHCGAVCAVGVTEDKKIVLVKQFRKSIEKDIIEIPAGKLEPGEKPDEAIIREFKEETGYEVSNLRYMTYFYTTPGFSDEVGHIYFLDARDKGDTNFDEDEDIEIIELSLRETKEMIYSKEIVDAKTILGIMMYSDYIEKD